MENKQIKKGTCPCCGSDLSAATCVEGEHKPSAGDISVCFYCFAWLQFTIWGGVNEDLYYEVLKEDVIDTLKKEYPETYQILVETTTQLKRFKMTNTINFN